MSLKYTVQPFMLDERDLMPYFQPILALDSRLVIGYEVLGRYRTDEGAASLGPFFTDANADVREQVRVDRIIRERAIARLAQASETQRPLLFLNVKPSWIDRTYQDEGKLQTLRMLERHGIDPDRVVIEITEDRYAGSMQRLSEIVGVYRRAGCRIAIDDTGTGFNSADRIAELHPDILKVDIHLMKRSASHSGYLAVLRSYSVLAEQIGASLLIEGVETEDDLQRAIQLGARYVQGYLFAPAEPEFQPKDRYAGIVDRGLAEHRRSVRRSEARWRETGEMLSGCLQSVRSGLGSAGGSADDADRYDRLVEGLAEKLPDTCIRVYLCREDGEQLSSNFQREGGRWVRQPEYRGSNWSWRPYFVADMLHPAVGVNANISRSYADLGTRRWIRTISASLAPGLIVLFDIMDEEAAVKTDGSGLAE
jgi:EAL domain-containing protein (putative c-di-GMP-specific phosphodiesterase class I)